MNVKSFDLPGRALKWKLHVQEQLASMRQQIDEFAAIQSEMRKRLSEHEKLSSAIFEILPSLAAPSLGAIELGVRSALARRGDALLILLMGEKDAPFLNAGTSAAHIAPAIVTGEIKRVFVKHFANAGPFIAHPAGELLLSLIRLVPGRASEILRLDALHPEALRDGVSASHVLCEALCNLLAERPDLVDFAAAEVQNAANNVSSVPFDRPDMLPRLIPAEPKRRSALFLHNSYYHFNCLSEGLRRRGWDAMTVSVENPDSSQQQFYHGEDLNLFDPDPVAMREKTRQFFLSVPERFGALHFYGMGHASFFCDLFENSEQHVQPPFDFFELKRHRTVIGFMPSGCMEGAPQSAIRVLSGNICGRCIWETRPDVCSDLKSLAWAKRLEQVCDWIGIEGDWPAGPRTGDKYVHGPVVTTLDVSAWRPDLVVPEDLKVQRKPGTVLIYHAVGNFETRRAGDRDIKGTGAVFAAVNRLKAEGLPVELYFATNVPSRVVRFVQVQADIVIDQLVYGRCGANARECMMLGRPIIIRLDPRQGSGIPPLRAVQEAPLVDATEQNVADVLRELVQNPHRRADLGRKAREFAIAWYGSDACAERYEKVIDRVREGLKPDSPELYPSSVN